MALSTALVAAVACAMASLNAAVHAQIDASMGSAQVRVQPAGGATMPASILGKVRAWEGVRAAHARLDTTLTLAVELPTLAVQPDGAWRATPRAYRVSAFMTGVDLDAEFEARPPKLVVGRAPSEPGEVLIDASLARRLGYADGRALDVIADPLEYLSLDPVGKGDAAATRGEAEERNAGVGVRVSDTLTVIRAGGPGLLGLLGGATVLGDLQVVGIVEAPPLGGKPTGVVALSTLESLSDNAGRISMVEIELHEGVDPKAFAERHKADLGEGIIVQTTARITSGVEKNLAASRIGLVLVGGIALLCAGFIIMTGLSTGVAEQQRTLAVLRCVGATRGQLGVSQLLAGGLVGVLGAVTGVPLGVAMTWVLSRLFERQMPEGVSIPPLMLTLVVAGALGAGLCGALWPAWRAASLSPLAALAARATPPTARGIVRVSLAAVTLISLMAAVVLGIHDARVFFWAYALLGLPAMFIGYFLLAVPTVVLVARFAGPALARALGIPPALLTRVVRASPYRHGFTAGALMTGLALMIGIWTNGGSALRDWLGQIRFPDAFAAGLAISANAEPRIAAVPGVARTTPITMTVVEIDTFGVEGLSEYKTQFFGLDFGTLSEMFEVRFVEGDRDTAVERLEQGGAVIVAREFQAARGLGVGDTFACRFNGVEHEFEIVGVVMSPGLEFISQFFDFGSSFVHQTVSSVVGSPADAAELFGAVRPVVIGIELEPDADEAEAVARITEATMGTGVLNVGSGRVVRERIETLVRGTLTVFSTVAVGAMLVACLGVVNLIVAEVQSRRFELGVIRSVGGSRAQMVKLVCAQAMLIGLAACVLGTMLGLQAAWGGQAVNRRVVGMVLSVQPPLGAIAFGWATAMSMAVLAAAPTAARIARTSPRALLASRE